MYAIARAMPEGAYLELGALTSAVPTARTWARVVWSGWNLARLADDGALVLTELITNAVLHAKSDTLHIFLRSDRSQLAIMVGDASPEMPLRADALSDDELFGRGLVIVESLAQHWGAYRVPTGKIVWALLA
ncbi:MAG TPA: ATP-binding protein [Streptosporangiaceae bacterium]|nr:ATP-binding protein [Streptosporangiaceae bacterium]